MERHILTDILTWKLAYNTPYDFIQVITLHLVKTRPAPQAFEQLSLVNKATLISELLLLSISEVRTA